MLESNETKCKANEHGKVLYRRDIIVKKKKRLRDALLVFVRHVVQNIWGKPLKNPEVNHAAVYLKVREVEMLREDSVKAVGYYSVSCKVLTRDYLALSGDDFGSYNLVGWGGIWLLTSSG